MPMKWRISWYISCAFISDLRLSYTQLPHISYCQIQLSVQRQQSQCCLINWRNTLQTIQVLDYTDLETFRHEADNNVVSVNASRPYYTVPLITEAPMVELMAVIKMGQLHDGCNGRTVTQMQNLDGEGWGRGGGGGGGEGCKDVRMVLFTPKDWTTPNLSSLFVIFPIAACSTVMINGFN